MRTSVKFVSVLAIGMLPLSMSNNSFAVGNSPKLSLAKLSANIQDETITLKADVNSMNVATAIVKSTYLKALADAKAGRDRALADLKAGLQQDLITAGKDKNAQKIARETSASNKRLIWNSYNQAIALALTSYKNSLKSLAKK